MFDFKSCGSSGGSFFFVIPVEKSDLRHFRGYANALRKFRLWRRPYGPLQ